MYRGRVYGSVHDAPSTTAASAAATTTAAASRDHTALVAMRALRAGVERIAQPLAEEVEPHDRDEDRDGGRDREPLHGAGVRLGFVQHRAPRRRGRDDADAEVAEHRLDDD